MVTYLRFILAVAVSLLISVSAFGVQIDAYGYIGPGDPDHVDYAASLDTWWHDGGAPLGPTTPNDSIDIFPDKNHHVGTFTETVASPALIASYMRNLDAEELVSVLPVVSYGDIYGDYRLGPYQDLTAATDHYFPVGTEGRPVYFFGDNGHSGMIFRDVADEMLVQFLSSDKNDGWIEILVNDVIVKRFDTWTQGWWYFTISGLDPDVADKVELRTRWNDADNESYCSDHVNTLDWSSNSENWWHLMPGDEGYPHPDDFHISYVAYNYVIPEPATFVFVCTGLATGFWLKRRKRRGTG